VFFDPRFSVKGALISAGKAPKREKDPSDFAIIGQIMTPNALPLFRDKEARPGMAKYLQRKDPVKSKMPEKNQVSGPVKSANTSFFFTKYVSETRNADNFRSEDPREALLRYAEQSSSDPIFLGPAYKATQPANILSAMTLEQEKEDARKKQRTDHM
jgi:hypothetical protein